VQVTYRDFCSDANVNLGGNTRSSSHGGVRPLLFFVIITRQKDVTHFYKWRVPILEIGSGHISPASLKRSGRFFSKRAKNLSVNLVIKGGMKNE
jgi:hypothetical protein